MGFNLAFKGLKLRERRKMSRSAQRKLSSQERADFQPVPSIERIVIGTNLSRSQKRASLDSDVRQSRYSSE